jgi:hypothetical protein
MIVSKLMGGNLVSHPCCATGQAAGTRQAWSGAGVRRPPQRLAAGNSPDAGGSDAWLAPALGLPARASRDPGGVP